MLFCKVQHTCIFVNESKYANILEPQEHIEHATISNISPCQEASVAAALPAFIQKVQDSNLGRSTGYSDVSNRPRLPISKSLPTNN
jgi:hypothetical protein